MRTTVTINDEIFKELMRFNQAKTKTEAIHRALTEWVRRQKIEKLKAMRGKLFIDNEVDDLRRLEIEEMNSLHG